MFLGLAVPGTADLRASEDLVGIWRISENRRFMNYRARFSVLDAQSISREWIEDIVAGAPHSDNAPRAWTKWISTGRYRVLRAARSLEYRTKDEQIPVDPDKRAILERIHQYFQGNFHVFERCAAELAKLMLPDIFEIDLTQPSRDGGRDAVGRLQLGSGVSGILVDFALEAKCYRTSNGVGRTRHVPSHQPPASSPVRYSCDHKLCQFHSLSGDQGGPASHNCHLWIRHRRPATRAGKFRTSTA